MRMRDLERASGVGRETIRYYIREGLLPEPDRASRNSASYSDAHVNRLKAIKRLQEERFLPLAVIRSLLDAGDSERWLATEAFPMLDTMLMARLEAVGGNSRVAVATMMAQLGITSNDIAENTATGMISVDGDATMSARDAAILRNFAELDAIGFTRELGFTPDKIGFYIDFIEWVTAQEMRLFFEHTAGHVGEARAIDMAERGVAIVNDILAQLRTRTLLRKLGERRRVANDNG